MNSSNAKSSHSVRISPSQSDGEPEILRTVLPQFPDKSRFVITTFDRDASYTSIEEVMGVTPGQIDSLSGSVITLSLIHI